MEFSFDRQRDSDPSNIANERLRKAIERNRQRQKEREEREQREQQQGQQTQQTQFAHQQAQFSNQTQFHQQEFRTRPQTPPEPPPRPQPESQTQQIHEEPIIEQPTRKTVARPHDTEFVAVKRTTKRAAPALNYHTTSNRKKSKPLDPVIVSFLTKCAWIFAGFLVLRLLFAKGGVTDFYSQHSLLTQRQEKLAQIKSENMQLVREIERMRSDAGYQKKLVRDNLGFIAADEFLVLFPKE